MTSDRLRDAVSELDAYRSRMSPIGDTPDLFTAISTVVENAGSVWKLENLETIREYARTHSEFTVEDLAPLMSQTYDMRAIGGLMLEAQRRGYIRKLGWVGSGRERHGRPVRLWTSLIRPGGAA